MSEANVKWMDSSDEQRYREILEELGLPVPLEDGRIPGQHLIVEQI